MTGLGYFVAARMLMKMTLCNVLLGMMNAYGIMTAMKYLPLMSSILQGLHFLRVQTTLT